MIKPQNSTATGMLVHLPRALLLVLGLAAAALTWQPSLRAADQTEEEATNILTSGQWMFHGVPRTFNRDGTYTSKNSTKGTWQIKAGELDVSLGRSTMRFNLPVDPRGTSGSSAGGIPQTLSRVGSGDEPKPAGPLSVTPPAPLVSGDTRLSPARLVQTYRDSLVFVTGEKGEGSGFVADMGTGNFLVTNVHVIEGIPGAEFRKLDGATVQGGAPSMAAGQDIFCMALPAGGTPLPIMREVDSKAAIGDEVVVLGNADGAGVINTITGKIVGIGPNLVEVDAPFQHGNSGSPIIHLKTGTVIGVATYAITNQYDLLTNRKRPRPEVRRFGYRLDTVKEWRPVRWDHFWRQAREIESITDLTEDLENVFRDIIEHRGSVTPGLHTNPALRNGLANWCDSQKNHDNRFTIDDLASFLKEACKSDIDAAQGQITDHYFQQELATQKRYREGLAATFNTIFLEMRR